MPVLTASLVSAPCECCADILALYTLRAADATDKATRTLGIHGEDEGGAFRVIMRYEVFCGRIQTHRALRCDKTRITFTKK